MPSSSLVEIEVEVDVGVEVSWGWGAFIGVGSLSWVVEDEVDGNVTSK